MARPTPESLLISAMINSYDAAGPKGYGVHPEHFFGYRAEYDWVLSFAERHGRTPTSTETATVFGDFPFSEDQEDIKWPASEVVRQYSSRRLGKAILAASRDIQSGEIEEAFKHFENVTLHTVAEKPKSLLSDDSFLDHYDAEPQKRIALPWATVQNATDGIAPGELWYLAARPGQGKSWSMLTMAAHAVMAGEKVVMYSLEMSKPQVQLRMHTLLARMLGEPITLWGLKTRNHTTEEYRQLLKKIDSDVPGSFDLRTPADGITTPSVVAAHAEEYDLNIVDYIGLMKADGGGRAIDDWRVIASMSNDLKQIALAKNTRLLVASQINRDGDSSGGRRPPQLKHMAQSDALGQDGDGVITMVQYGKGVTMYSLEKYRDGESGKTWFTRFDPNTGNFDEVDSETAADIRDATDSF